MQENSTLDCEKFTGRKRDICRGFDDAGNPVLTPEKCASYRRLWAEQAESREPTAESQTPPAKHFEFVDPCVHRGAEIDSLKSKLCALKGLKGLRVPVHQCALHETCVPKKYTTRKSPHAVCLSCDQRKEPDEVSDLEKFFERVYCVNLDRRADRWKQFLRRLPDDWPFKTPERAPAIDGKKCKHPDWWNAGGGAWGCYKSHLNLIERCLNEGVNSVLLLEDDALFPPDFTARVAGFLQAVPDDWGMIYLGGQHLKARVHAPRKVNDKVFIPYNVNRTHAFALRGETMRKVYQHLCRKDWNKAQHIDHHLGRFHQRREDPIYCPAEWLVGQAEGKSNISWRDLPDRYWEPAGELESIKPDSRPFLAIVGLHSSGSSLLAGVCHRLGVHLGNKLTGAHDVAGDGNRGFEAIGLANLCERAIPFPAVEIALPEYKIERQLRRWVNEKRWEAQKKKTLAGGKYPMLCRMASQLRIVCGDRLRVLHIDRPLEESIQSLIRRCPRKDPEQLRAHQAWLWDGKQELLRSGADQLTVNYHDLLADSEREARRMAEWLGIEADEAKIKEAAAIVDPSRRRVKLEGAA